MIRWLHSFGKQFNVPVTGSDYKTMRFGFIMTHCPGNLKYNFHKYLVQSLEDDFKVVVGLSWYLWIFVVIFLLLNVDGWNAYFWISSIPLILLLVVGTKLEHVMTQLAHDVAERHIAIEGELKVTPSDEHFWLQKPQIILYLIHFILFQNAFEIAIFFWILTTFAFDSCLMGKFGFIIPRLVIGVIVQLLCSYSTLPLYGIVTQMGSSFKRAIFNESMQEAIAGWAQKARHKQKGMKSATDTNKLEEGSPGVLLNSTEGEIKIIIQNASNGSEVAGHDRPI